MVIIECPRGASLSNIRAQGAFTELLKETRFSAYMVLAKGLMSSKVEGSGSNSSLTQIKNKLDLTDNH